MRAFASLIPLALLAGCGGKNDNDPGPGGVTVGEARALDEAAEMIEQRGLDPAPSVAPAPSASAKP
jgi:hypothetical protein